MTDVNTYSYVDKSASSWISLTDIEYLRKLDGKNFPSIWKVFVQKGSILSVSCVPTMGAHMLFPLHMLDLKMGKGC